MFSYSFMLAKKMNFLLKNLHSLHCIALQKNGDQGLQVDLPCDAAFHYIVNRQRLVGVMGGHGG